MRQLLQFIASLGSVLRRRCGRRSMPTWGRDMFTGVWVRARVVNRRRLFWRGARRAGAAASQQTLQGPAGRGVVAAAEGRRKRLREDELEKRARPASRSRRDADTGELGRLSSLPLTIEQEMHARSTRLRTRDDIKRDRFLFPQISRCQMVSL